MATKFVSKNSNYMLVLRPGIEGNRALGTHAVPGLYVKFQAGMVDVKEESIIDMLRAHPSFGTEFVEVKQDEVDPFVDVREEIEPTHFTTEIKYGHAEGTTGGPKVKVTPAMKKFIEKEALKMLPGYLKANPKVLQDIVMGLSAGIQSKEEKKEEKKEAVVVEAPKVSSVTAPKADITQAPAPIEDLLGEAAS